MTLNEIMFWFVKSFGMIDKANAPVVMTIALTVLLRYGIASSILSKQVNGINFEASFWASSNNFLSDFFVLTYGSIQMI